MLLNYISKKCIGHCKFTKSQEKTNHLMYIDDIKIFVKNERLVTLKLTIKIYSLYIGMEFGIEKCAMLIIKSGQRVTLEGIELQNQE